MNNNIKFQLSDSLWWGFYIFINKNELIGKDEKEIIKKVLDNLEDKLKYCKLQVQVEYLNRNREYFSISKEVIENNQTTIYICRHNDDIDIMN